jgi:hypothetical protein
MINKAWALGKRMFGARQHKKKRKKGLHKKSEALKKRKGWSKLLL